MKRFIAFVVIVYSLVWLGGRISAGWRSYLKNDPYAPQLDVRGARKTIALLDEDWAQAARHFAAGDFARSETLFVQGWSRMDEYTFRHGNGTYAAGQSLNAWLATHRTAWAASLDTMREDLAASLAHQADLTNLEKLRQRISSPTFDAFGALLRSDIAAQARSHPNVVVITLADGGLTRAELFRVADRILTASDDLYILYGSPAEAAALGWCKFVGSLRLSAFETGSPYTYADGNQRGTGTAGHRPASGSTVIVPTQFRVLFEPDPFAQANFSTARDVWSSTKAELPETILLGAQHPFEHVSAHRNKLVQSLLDQPRLRPLHLRGNPNRGLSALEPLPLRAGGAMPELDRDSSVEKVFRAEPAASRTPER